MADDYERTEEENWWYSVVNAPMQEEQEPEDDDPPCEWLNVTAAIINSLNLALQIRRWRKNRRRG